MDYNDLSFREKIKYHKNGFVEVGSRDIFFKELPSSYRENKIENGENGCCYKIDDETAFKFLFDPNCDYYRLQALNKVDVVPGFVLPKKLVYVDKKFVGYLMDYIDGHTLEKDISYLRSDRYLSELKRFEDSILLLSMLKVYAVDVYPDNMMIDKDGRIYAIDTDLYCISSAFRDVYPNNLAKYNDVLLSQIIRLKSIISKELSFKNEILNSKSCYTFEGNYSASDLLRDLLCELEKHNCKTESIGDVKSSMKLILK